MCINPTWSSLETFDTFSFVLLQLFTPVFRELFKVYRNQQN